MLLAIINDTLLAAAMVYETKDSEVHEGEDLPTYDLLLFKSSWDPGESEDLATRWASTRRVGNL